MRSTVFNNPAYIMMLICLIYKMGFRMISKKAAKEVIFPQNVLNLIFNHIFVEFEAF